MREKELGSLGGLVLDGEFDASLGPPLILIELFVRDAFDGADKDVEGKMVRFGGDELVGPDGGLIKHLLEDGTGVSA